MVTMQTAYLRTHYPMEFFAALLSKGQAADLQTYVNDIRRQGFEILPVDVNLSKADHRVEGNGIRLALSSVKGIGPSAVQKVVAGQPYASFVGFLLDSGASKTIVDVLVRTGAFTDLEPGVSVSTLVARHEAFRADRRLSHKKNRDIVAPTLGAIEGPPDDPIELMERERELLGFNLRGTPFSINGRYEKIDRLVAEGLCRRGWAEFLEDESEQVLIAPLLVKAIKERPQKNGKLFAFLRLTDRDGNEREAAAFANIWEHVRTGVRAGDVYVMIVNRRDDDPGSFLVGRPGWAQSAKSAVQAFIPIDGIKV
jgi:DNA polymerase-3 subunit alpha